MATVKKVIKLTSNLMGVKYTVYFKTIEEYKSYIESLINNQLWFDTEFISIQSKEYREYLKKEGLI